MFTREMKKLICLPFLLFFLPNTVNAESVWLIIRYVGAQKSGALIRGGALEKIEMANMEQCELMGAKWVGSRRSKLEHDKSVFGFECLIGK